MLALPAVVAAPWDAASLARFVKMRTQGEDATWVGQGTLTNAINGQLIAHVKLLERCSFDHTNKNRFYSEKVLVYLHDNGTPMKYFGRKSVPVLRFCHQVSLQLQGSQLAMLAADKGTNRQVANGVTTGSGPRCNLLGNYYELFIRPAKGGQERRRPMDAHLRYQARGESGAQTPRAVSGTTREMYRFSEPRLLGRQCNCVYQRTGRCPSWYGAGLCTLEVHSQATRRILPSWTKPWLKKLDDDAGARFERGP